VTIAAIGDLHCGGTTGLHPDTPTVLDDGGLFTPSEVQIWNFHNWLDFWDRAGKHGPLHIVLNGDAVDGNHHGTVQIVSPHPIVQCDIFKACWIPVLERIKVASFVMVRGTEVHVGQSGGVEEALGRWLAGQGVPVVKDEGNFSHWHFRGSYGGVKVDATHHGRFGARPWTKAGAVSNLAMQIFIEYHERGEEAPDLCLRSHHHRYLDTHDNAPVRVIQLPCWQMATGYAKRVAPETLSDLGGSIIRCQDGRILDVDTIRYKPARPIHWRPM
jgi:hypothetical protein